MRERPRRGIAPPRKTWVERHKFCPHLHLGLRLETVGRAGAPYAPNPSGPVGPWRLEDLGEGPTPDSATETGRRGGPGPGRRDRKGRAEAETTEATEERRGLGEDAENRHRCLRCQTKGASARGAPRAMEGPSEARGRGPSERRSLRHARHSWARSPPRPGSPPEFPSGAGATTRAPVSQRTLLRPNWESGLDTRTRSTLDPRP